MKSSASHDSDVFERKIRRQMGAWNYVKLKAPRANLQWSRLNTRNRWTSRTISTFWCAAMHDLRSKFDASDDSSRTWSSVSSSARWIISAIISTCKISIQAESKKANTNNWISGAVCFQSNFSRCRGVSWSMIRMRAERNWKKFVDSLTEWKYFTGTEHEHDSWLRHGGIVNWKTKGNYRKCHFSWHHHIAGFESKSFCH